MTDTPYNNEQFTIKMWRYQYRPLNEDSIDMGANYDLLKTIDPHYIWTECDFDDVTVIKNGWHRINEQGVFITLVPWEDGETIFAIDENEDKEDEEEDDSD